MYKFVLGFSLASLLFVPKWAEFQQAYLWCIDGRGYSGFEMAMGQLGIYIFLIALGLLALALVAIIKGLATKSAGQVRREVYGSRAPSEARDAE